MHNVSIILPCFNHGQYVAQAIESILSQTHKDFELIVTDDCSTDNSLEVINCLARTDSRIKVIRHDKNLGLPRSRNDGLQVASGEFIAFCDSDDIWEPDKIQTQIESLVKHPDDDIVYCETLIIDQNGSLTGQHFSDLYPLPKNQFGWIFHELVTCNFINVQSALMRRRCLKSVDHFDEDLRVLEDWWYWIQLARNHRFLYIPRALARYRIHSQSMSAMKKRSFPINRVKIYTRMLRKYTDISCRAKADIFYSMGVDLAQIGKFRMAKRLLWKAVGLSTRGTINFNRLIKAMVRLTIISNPIQLSGHQHRQGF